MINEIIHGPSLINVVGNAGAANPSGYVTINMLQSLLYELFGTGQYPVGAAPSIGSTFPAGAAATGTLPMVANVDVTSLSSPAGGTPALKSFAMPAGALSTSGFRGVRIQAWGSFANNASAKTVLIKFGATTLITVTATVSVANSWSIEASVWVRTATTQTACGRGMQGAGTPTFVTLDSSPGETIANSISIACSGTQTSAADIIQDGFIVDYIP